MVNMIIRCKSCFLRYLVSSKVLGDQGRVVKCSNCGFQWFQHPPILPKGHDAVSAVADGGSGNVANGSTKATLSKNVAAGKGAKNSTKTHTTSMSSSAPAIWVIPRSANYYFMLMSFFFISCIFVSVMLLFNDVLPASASKKFYNSFVFKALDISDVKGLHMDDLHIIRDSFDHGVVTINGAIVNGSSSNKMMPFIKIVLKDDNDKVISNYSIKPNGKVIVPGSHEKFSYQLINFPDKTEKVVVDMGNKLDVMLR